MTYVSLEIAELYLERHYPNCDADERGVGSPGEWTDQNANQERFMHTTAEDLFACSHSVDKRTLVSRHALTDYSLARAAGASRSYE